MESLNLDICVLFKGGILNVKFEYITCFYLWIMFGEIPFPASGFQEIVSDFNVLKSSS